MKLAPLRSVTALAFVLLALLCTGLASAQSPQCSSQITACGCTITTAGSYTAEDALYASQGLTLKGGCIDIQASNVNLELRGNINGPGTGGNCLTRLPNQSSGVGVHVLPSASSVAIFFAEAACGWNYGLESEGTSVHLYAVAAYGNNVGIFLNNATANDVLYADAEFGVVGYQITGGSGNSINATATNENSQYGYWIDGSKLNILGNNVSYDDKIAGFYLGCNAKGQVNPSIPCNKNTPTTGNSLVNNYWCSGENCGTTYTSKYGIAVEKESINNNFNGNVTGAGTFVKDIIDGNGNCIYNHYEGDSFLTASPRCIQ